MSDTEGGQEKSIEELVEKTKEETEEKPADESKEELTEKQIEKSAEEQLEKNIEKSSGQLVDELKEKTLEQPAYELKEEVSVQLTDESKKDPIGAIVEKMNEELKDKPINVQEQKLSEKSAEEQVEESKNKPGDDLGEVVEKPIEESTEEPIKEPIKRRRRFSKEKRRKKIFRGIIISFCALLIIYFVMTLYFKNHFFFGSKINSISVSGKTVEGAKEVLTSQIQNYTLTLKERENKNEQIKGSDIVLKYNLDEEVNKLKNGQNPFSWCLALFTSKKSKMAIGMTYDEVKLKEKIDTLSCLDSSNVVEPKSASFQYQDSGYVIMDEVMGNKVDTEILSSKVLSSILSGQTQIDLESAGCYINPPFNSKSEKAKDVKENLDKYVSTKITYTIVDNKESLDGATINQWLKVDNNLEITFDEDRLNDYMYKLSATYNTVGKARTFVTSSKTTINISGGDYGLIIDKDTEKANLIKDIKEGKTTTREPAYSQTPFCFAANDIGTTYVEVDMSKQHLWFYKNGALVTQGDVVTGNMSNGHATPKGVYILKYKERNAILRGQGYAAPVNYWMPFNLDIGIHDATWRNGFGGNIYMTNGSHGCVNAPLDLAKTIFNNIDAGTPVVCYY